LKHLKHRVASTKELSAAAAAALGVSGGTSSGAHMTYGTDSDPWNDVLKEEGELNALQQVFVDLTYN
jgi:hypothetical protein